MSRSLIGILLLLSFSCSAQEYPTSIKEHRLEKQYDKTKWYLYCIECDHPVQFQYKSNYYSKKITYGELPLKFDYLNIKYDTIEINFCFYYKNIKLDRPILQYTPYWGALYRLNSTEILEFSLKGEIRYTMVKCDDIRKCHEREVKPLQPEVIKYIKQNRDKLDPWFRLEAIKRSVIK